MSFLEMALWLAALSAGTLSCTRCCGRCDTCIAHIAGNLHAPFSAGGKPGRVSCAEAWCCGNAAYVVTTGSSRCGLHALVWWNRRNWV